MAESIKITVVCAFAAIATQPLVAQQRATPITTWFTDADFPPDPNQGNEDGLARVHFTVTPNGRAADCKVEYATGPKSLGDHICALVMERARYVPAYAKSGEPIDAEDQITISFQSGRPIVGENDFGGAIPANNPSRWITPRDGLPKVLRSGPGRIEIHLTYRIGADGRMHSCKGTAPASPDAVEATCKLMTRRARFRSPLGRDGKPLETEGKSVIVWETFN